MKEILLKALRTKYEAQAAEAEATLEVYYTNAAGIGEHPQVVDEMSKQVEVLANARDCLNVLNENLKDGNQYTGP